MSNLTKLALAKSLKTQMETTPLSKITVNDIVNDCGLNRRTLYYHFHDIYDLLEWIYKTEINDVIHNNKTIKTWQKGFLDIFLYLNENKKVVLNTYHSIGRDTLENHLYNELYDAIIQVVEESSINLNVSESEKKYVANFYKIAFVGILIEWIKHDMKENPEKIIMNLNKIISGDIRRALEKFSK